MGRPKILGECVHLTITRWFGRAFNWSIGESHSLQLFTNSLPWPAGQYETIRNLNTSCNLFFPAPFFKLVKQDPTTNRFPDSKTNRTQRLTDCPSKQCMVWLDLSKPKPAKQTIHCYSKLHVDSTTLQRRLEATLEATLGATLGAIPILYSELGHTLGPTSRFGRRCVKEFMACTI